MIEKLQQSLNFTNSEGEVITFFDGKLTISQAILILIAIVAVLIVLKCIKGIVKAVIVGGIAVFVCINMGILSPTQVRDIGEQIYAKGVSAYESIAEASENIKIEDSTIKIQLNDKWYDVKDVKSFVPTDEGISIKIGDDTIAIKDGKIVELIKSFK